MQQASAASNQLNKTAKKLNNVQKLAKPKKNLSANSKFKNGGAAAYWGYKAFQALRVRACFLSYCSASFLRRCILVVTSAFTFFGAKTQGDV